MFDRETTAAMYPGITSPVRLGYERYKSLFVLRHLNHRLLIACLLQLIQQFTGINAIIYYAPQIFENIGLEGSSVNLLATGVVGIINFVCTLPAILLLDYYGRKTLLLIGAVGMGIAQLVVATIYAVYKDSWASHTDAGWAAAVFIWLYIACFAFSIGCINWIIPSEIFPPGVRAQAVGIAIGVNWLSNVSTAISYHNVPLVYLTMHSSSLPLLHQECSGRSDSVHSTSSSVCRSPCPTFTTCLRI